MRKCIFIEIMLYFKVLSYAISLSFSLIMRFANLGHNYSRLSSKSSYTMREISRKSSREIAWYCQKKLGIVYRECNNGTYKKNIKERGRWLTHHVAVAVVVLAINSEGVNLGVAWTTPSKQCRVFLAVSSDFSWPFSRDFSHSVTTFARKSRVIVSHVCTAHDQRKRKREAA